MDRKLQGTDFKGMEKNKLLEGFFRILFSIAIPITLQNLMQTFINMMDTIMVGRLGSTEIAAVGLGNQIFFMLNMLLFGISSGGSIFVSQFWGANDIKSIRKTTGIMVSFAIIPAVLFTFGGILIPEFLIGLYTKDQLVIQIGARYLKVAALSYCFMAISFSLQMAYRSTEHVVLPMVTTSISFVLNITFNYLLIFGYEPLEIPSFGATGAALGTLISRIVEMFITVLYGYFKKFEVLASIKEVFSFNKEHAVKVLKVAFPVIMSEFLWGLGITFQNGIFSHAGTAAFASFSIMNTVSQLTWVFFIGMGNASAIILGKKIGEENELSAKAFAHRYCWFFPLCGLVIGFFLFPLGLLLPYVFNVETEVISITQQLLKVLLVTYPFRAFNILLVIGICRSGGDTIFASIIDNGWMWLLSIPLAAAAAFVWELSPWMILVCFETEQVLKAICGLLRVKSGKWLRNVTK